MADWRIEYRTWRCVSDCGGKRSATRFGSGEPRTEAPTSRLGLVRRFFLIPTSSFCLQRPKPDAACDCCSEHPGEGRLMQRRQDANRPRAIAAARGTIEEHLDPTRSPDRQ